MRLDPIFLIILSDLFVNLAAGWFGSAFILPITSRKKKFAWWVLLMHIGFGTISLLVSYILRRLAI